MKTFGLIGFPLAQSFSQKYFTQKFEKEAINARYLNFPIETIYGLPELINQHPYIAGLNVTIPYKKDIFKYLDEIDPIAREAGAVNVVKFDWSNKTPKLKGYNSDIVGFRNSLTPLLEPHHKRALILGTGGASKAVEYTLQKLNIEYKFVSRTPKDSLTISYNDLTKELIENHTLIINSTPLGMYPNIESKPEIPYSAIHSKHLLYDLVYNPEITTFLQKGLDQGAAIKNGLDMLYGQAQEAWRIWNEEE